MPFGKKKCKKLQFKKVRSNYYFLKGNILLWKYFHSITFKHFLCLFWSQISTTNSTWVLVFGKKVSNQTKSRENFSSHYIKKLAGSMMSTSRNPGSLLSLHRTTILFAHRKTVQVSSKRLQSCDILIFPCSLHSRKFGNVTKKSHFPWHLGIFPPKRVKIGGGNIAVLCFFNFFLKSWGRIIPVPLTNIYREKKYPYRKCCCLKHAAQMKIYSYYWSAFGWMAPCVCHVGCWIFCP